MNKILPLLALGLTVPLAALAQTSVWKVTKGDATVYLGGTCHLLRPADLPLPAEYDQAYAAAQKIYFETDIARILSPEMQQIITTRGLYGPAVSVLAPNRRDLMVGRILRMSRSALRGSSGGLALPMLAVTFRPTIVAAMPLVLFPTTFGTCGIAWNETGLTGFQLPEESAAATEQQLARKVRSQPATEPPPLWVQAVIERVQQHLQGKVQDFTGTVLDWSRVTDFQQAVYLQAWAIKPGYKKSYGEIAKLMALGHEAARAVGMALATNPWPLIVPCHRVVSAGDKMTGFSAPGGVRTKTRLLTLEGAELLSE